MRAQTPAFAPIVMLAFLTTVGLILASVTTFVVGWWKKNPRLRWSSVLLLCGLAGGYAGVLVVMSLLSREVVLPPGARKYFCELDCHIGYSVESSLVVSPVLGELQPQQSDAGFLVVGVKSWFDPRTISAHRGNGPLTPNGRKIELLDDSGNSIPRSPGEQEEKVLRSLSLASTPLNTALHPGESYLSYVVFAVPQQIGKSRLLLTSADEESPLLLGHENSYFHRKIYFALPDSRR